MIQTTIKSAKALGNILVHDAVVIYSQFIDMLSETKITVAEETLEVRVLRTVRRLSTHCWGALRDAEYQD